MRSVVDELNRFNRGRDPERLRMKYARMRLSAFAFLRGSAHLFYAQLPRSLSRGAPRVWACGDLHLENLGSYRGDNGQVYFDINDFDEALRCPATWDLLRVLTSLHVARKTFGASEKDAQALATLLVDSYARALADGKARWVERETAQSPVRALLGHADASHQRSLLEERTRKGRIRLDERRALKASDRDHERVHALFEGLRAHHEHFARVKVRDVARRIAGTGSLGLERWVILVDGTNQREQLLDLKVAAPSAAIKFGPTLEQPAFASEATRIVSVQRRMQAIAMASLHPVKLGRTPFVLRRLLPSEDRVRLATLDLPRVENLLRTVAECLAWDQLRSSGREGAANADALIAFGGDTSWRANLLALSLTCARRVEQDYAEFSVSGDLMA